jgi:4-amino-4-deoxy-L-arabinose transferase-like glycosyltransferase
MNKRYYFLLVILLLFHIINNLIIINNDNTPLLWDGGDYFYRSLRYYDVFRNFGSDFITEFNDVSRYRPPLFLLSSLPFYLIFGRSPDVAAMTNVVYFIILVLSVYGIGKRIHSEEVGLLASFIVSTFPIIFGLSRSYWLDFPLTAMVSLSMYLLLMADYFKNKKYSILFGISAGLGMLTKWTYFVFLSGPFLYFFVSSFRSKSEKEEKITAPAFNALISILVGMVVASFWYIPNGLDVVVKLSGLSVGIASEEAIRFQQLGETIGPSGIFNIKSLTFYAGKLVNEQVTFIFAIIFLVSASLILKKERKETTWMLLLWIIVSVVIFTLIKNKTTRNTVPMLPAIGLMISLGIMRIKSGWIRKAVVTFVLFIGLFQYAVTSYGSSLLPKRLALTTSIGDVVFFEQPDNHSYAIFQANRGDWKADEILETINADRGEKKNIEIVLLPRDAFTWMTMEYTSYLKGMPFKFIGAVDSPKSVLYADYVLIKKGGFVAPWFGMDNIHRSLDLMEENIEGFILLKSVVLPEDKAFLPIYDTKATKRSYKSGVVFSGKLEVLEYSVLETRQGTGREFVIESTLKGLKDINGELMVALNFLNKKLEILMRKAVKPLPPISQWKVGEVKTIKTSFNVPSQIAEDFFSLEMGFYDSSKGEVLTYRPEYLIFKRQVLVDLD